MSPSRLTNGAAGGSLGAREPSKFATCSENVDSIHFADWSELRTAASQAFDDGRHQPRCTICRSPRLEDLESCYLKGQPMRRLASQFGFSERSVRRHIAWYHLDAWRIVWRMDDPASGRPMTVDALVRLCRLHEHLLDRYS